MARLAGSNLQNHVSTNGHSFEEYIEDIRRRKKEKGPYDDRSVGLVIHLAPTFSQNEHEGFLLSHFVLRALHTWHARFARLRGYAAVPLGAGRRLVMAASSLLWLSSAALSEPDPTVVVDRMIAFWVGNSGSAASSNCCRESSIMAYPRR